MLSRGHVLAGSNYPTRQHPLQLVTRIMHKVAAKHSDKYWGIDPEQHAAAMVDSAHGNVEMALDFCYINADGANTSEDRVYWYKVAGAIRRRSPFDQRTALSAGFPGTPGGNRP